MEKVALLRSHKGIQAYQGAFSNSLEYERDQRLISRKKRKELSQLVYMKTNSFFLNPAIDEVLQVNGQKIAVLATTQKACGFLEGRILEIDRGSREGQIEIDGYPYAFHIKRMFRSRDQLTDTVFPFLVWPTQPDLPQDLSYLATPRPLKKLQLLMIRRIPSGYPQNGVEAGGQLVGIWPEHFVIKLWSFQYRQYFLIEFFGRYPYPQHLGEYVWVKGMFNPATGFLDYQSSECLLPLPEDQARLYVKKICECKLTPEPEPIPLSVLYEDNHLIVINKPVGLAMYPSPGNQTKTLFNALLHHHSLKIKTGEQNPESSPPQLVHRLDKYTSGVLVVCKTKEAANHLTMQFGRHTIHRRYLAIALAENLPDEGTFCTGHQKHPLYAGMFTGQINTERKAITHYRILERFKNGFGLICCTLETGRSHQIRMHLSEANAPILGDGLYGDRRTTNPYIHRQALHATFLGFEHLDGRFLCFETPPPEDFQHALDAFRRL